MGWERQVLSEFYQKLRAKLRASDVNSRVNKAVESRRGPEAKMFPIMKKVAGECHQKELGGVRNDLRKKGAYRGGRSM